MRAAKTAVAAKVFPGEISRVECDLIPRLPGQGKGSLRGGRQSFEVQHRTGQVLDAMGEASARAQNLPHVITSASKLRNMEDHVAYIVVEDGSSVIGLLKVGRKNLFLFDSNGDQNEVVPLCILDFYVHESRQRTGIGRRLLECMLRDQNYDPELLAIDRPSPKLISFFSKHYGLTDHIPQVNNYHIFQGFFNNRPQEEGSLKAKKPRIYMGKLQYM